MALYSQTIDWDRHWTETEISERVQESPAAEYILDPLLAFIESRGQPRTFADVGCGPGAVPFEIAEQYPKATVTGYDSSEAVLQANRKRVRQRGLSNLRFERTVLPDFDPDRQFDIVSSFFTLCYVADIERALRNLYRAVAPEGYLVITYHNRFAQSLFKEIAESPHDYLDQSSSWDPDRFRDRFQLVLNGKALLSYDRIHDILDTWPQSVWSIADEVDPYGAWRQNPLVYIPKK